MRSKKFVFVLGVGEAAHLAVDLAELCEGLMLDERACNNILGIPLFLNINR